MRPAPIVFAMNTENPGNGHDSDDKNDEARIIPFPSKAEREKKQKEDEHSTREKIQAAQKSIEQARRAASGKQPFLKLGNLPPFTGAFVASFVLIYFLMATFASEGDRLALIYQFGFIPGAYTGAFAWDWTALITPLSHTLLHGGWMHVLFNAVMGLSLGTMFERLYGTRTTAIFFILCTLAGAATYLAFSPFAIVPVIGASGGISGFFAAVLLLLQQQNRLPMSNRFGPWPILIFWGLFMSVPGILMGEPVSWQAHLGGYAMGIALIIGLQKRKIRF
jgi:membrane associated rhomboid family serine protease